MNLFMYLRKSRSDDPGEPIDQTLERHRRILTDYAAKREDVITRIFQEVVSGESIVARPQMLALLQAVEEGQADGVLCLDIDRLGRGGMKDQGLILETLKYASTLIVTPEKTYNLSDDIDEQLTEFKSFMSRQEYKLINKRLQRGLLSTVQDGGYVSNPPFGYARAIINRLPSLEIFEEEAKYVRMIFDMYTTQGVGSQTIADHLTALGVTGKRSGFFSRSTVRTILTNPIYTGKVAWKRVTRQKSPSGKVIKKCQPKENWIVNKGQHAAIVDEVTFQRAQEIRTRHQHPPYRRGEICSPLAGVVRCANCQNNMHMHACRGRWFYIRCFKKGCCGSASYYELESLIIEHLSQRLLEVTASSSPAPDTASLDAQLSTLEKELLAMPSQKLRLMSFLEQGIYTVEEYQQRNAALSSRRKQVEATQCELTSRRLSLLGIDYRTFATQLQDVLSKYKASDTPTKNYLLKTVIDHIDYSRSLGRDQSFTISIAYLDF